MSGNEPWAFVSTASIVSKFPPATLILRAKSTLQHRGPTDDHAPPDQNTRRIVLVDALRGVALVAMAVYHFSWDLGFFGLADLGVTESPFWIAFARATAGSFLALAGVSLFLGHGEQFRPRPYLRRLAMIIAAAAAITLASWFADPDGIIWFGILHCIAVSSVLGLAFLRLPVPLILVAALACLVAPALFISSWFNSPGWLWLGLSAEAPPSNDYNPLLPWFGIFLCGIAAARLALAVRSKPDWSALWQPTNVAHRMLILAGQHSLLVYLVHQPLLLGILWLVGASNWNQRLTHPQRFAVSLSSNGVS